MPAPGTLSPSPAPGTAEVLRKPTLSRPPLPHVGDHSLRYAPFVESAICASTPLTHNSQWVGRRRPLIQLGLALAPALTCCLSPTTARQRPLRQPAFKGHWS